MEDDLDNFGKEPLKYVELSTIGSGTYGTVYQAKLEKSNKYIAIKKIKMDEESEGIPSTSLREICILRELNHENIVRC